MKPLRDDHALSPFERDLLEAGRTAAPAPAELDAMWSGIATGIAAGIAVHAAPVALSTAASTAGGATSSTLAAGSTTIPVAAATGTGVVVAKVVAALAIVAGAVAGGDAAYQAMSTPATAHYEQVASVHAIQPTSAPVTEPAIASVTAPAVQEKEQRPPVTHEDRPKPSPRVALPAEAPSIAIAPTKSLLDEESATVRSARKALRGGDAAGALRMLADADARFGKGSLEQEREVLAIDALSRTGDRAGAATRAAAFLRNHPGSPHAEAVSAFASP